MTKLETKGTMSQKWLNEQLERTWQERERWIRYTVALQLTEAGRHEKRRKPKSRSLPCPDTPCKILASKHSSVAP
jgi:hypothetical protein